MNIKTVGFLLATILCSVQEALGGCSLPGSPFTLSEMEGSIKSPGYPEEYFANEECNWSLKAPTGSYATLLSIIKVDMESNGYDVNLGCPKELPTLLKVGMNNACGQEKDICLLYIELPSYMKCYDKMTSRFPDCHVFFHQQWPLKFEFRSSVASNKSGFHIDYKLISCDETETTEGATETPIVAVKETTTKVEKTTSSTKPDVPAKASQQSVYLAVIISVLAVILVAIVILILLRKKLRVWIEERKSHCHRQKEEKQKEQVPYKDVYIIPTDGRLPETPSVTV